MGAGQGKKKTAVEKKEEEDPKREGSMGLKTKVARQLRKGSAIFSSFAKIPGVDKERPSTKAKSTASVEPVARASVDSTKIIRDITPDPAVGEALQSVPLFAHLTQTEREKIGGAVEELTLESGEIVFNEGDRGEAFFIIRRGVAKVMKLDTETGKQIALVNLTAGDHFGEQALVGNTGQLVSVQAEGELALWSIPRNIFKTLFKEDRIDIKFATRDEQTFKRGAVSAEVGESKESPLTIPASDMGLEVEQLVLRAVHNSLLFQAFEDEHKRKVVRVMQQQTVVAGEVLIVEGTEGNTFYVIEEGEFDVYQLRDGVQVRVDNHKTGGSFGELALMYDAPRNATVVAVCDSKVRALQRVWFNQIAKELGVARLEQYSNWLKRIELLAPLTNFERNQIAEALEVVDIESAGVDIFKQGERGDAMYIVVRGEVQFTCVNSTGTVEEIGRCGEEDYFGERALVDGSLRTVTATTTMGTRLVKLDVDSFVSLLGPLEEHLKKKAGKFEPTQVEWKRVPIGLEDLKVIGVLGQGSYGSVMLTQAPDGVTYALKAVSKQRIVETKQKDHIYNEKNLMAQMDHPMLVRLFNTYQDADRLYFLLEPVLGGEMFPLLRKNKTFPPPQAKFYAACVVLAFEYMHKRDFIYRDLKPENLLLDNDGYLKITDFGFTKKVPHKTWTMCGTPEYMAPEIISHNGHGRAVDWWCIGIFIFEMLASYTPFYGKDGNMKMYERVVRGTFNVPSHISQEAKALIRGLLRTRPHMRLGMLKAGADSIKCHAWFQGFDWQAVLWKKMKAPYVPKVEGVCDVGNYRQDIKHLVVKPYVDDGTNWDADF